jgi:hypothetical protein
VRSGFAGGVIGKGGGGQIGVGRLPGRPRRPNRSSSHEGEKLPAVVVVAPVGVIWNALLPLIVSGRA